MTHSNETDESPVDFAAQAIAHRWTEVARQPLGNGVNHILSGDVQGYTQPGRDALAAAVIARDRCAADVPDLLAELHRQQVKLDRIAKLCDETDIETNEATQGWLVGNIRAVLGAAAIREGDQT